MRATLGRLQRSATCASCSRCRAARRSSATASGRSRRSDLADADWPFYELSIVPMLTALLRYALVLEQGRGAAPEEVFASDRVLQLLGRGVGGRVRPGGVPAMSDAHRTTTSLALVAGVDGWMTRRPGRGGCTPPRRAARPAAGSSRSAASGAARRSCWRRGRARRRRGRGHRPARRQRPRPAGDRRVRRRGGRATTPCSTPTSPPPASPTGCATCAAFSDAAHAAVDDPIDVLYIDGAHRYGRPAPTSATGAAGRRRRHAADPRLVLVDRRHAGDPARAGAGPAVPLRRAVALARRVPRRPRRPATGSATPPASSPSCRGSSATSASRCCSRSGSARLLRRLGRRVPEWPY